MLRTILPTTRLACVQDDGAADDDVVVELEPAASAPTEVRGGEEQEALTEAGHSLGEELQRQRRKMQEQQATPGLIEVQHAVAFHEAMHSASPSLGPSQQRPVSRCSRCATKLLTRVAPLLIK